MTSKKNKRILIWESLPIMGGGQRVSLQVGQILRASGKYDVEYLIPDIGPYYDVLEKDGFICNFLTSSNYSIGKKTIRDYWLFMNDTFRMILKLRNLQKKMKYNLLYIGGTRALIWGAVIGKLFHIPVIWHVHHVFSDDKVVSHIQRFGKLSIVKKILCVSKCVRDQYPLLKDKSEVLYNSINLSRFEHQTDKDIRQELKIPDNAYVLSFIGILQQLKRQDVLLNALPDILKYHPNTYVLLIGRARNNSDSYVEQLKELVREHKIVDRVFFLGQREDIPNILQATTVTVLAMGEEACPLVVLESCASGVPVVGPDVAGSAELIDLSNAGLKYKFNNPKFLAKVLIDLLNNKIAISDFSKQGIKFAKKKSVVYYNMKIQNIFSKLL